MKLSNGSEVSESHFFLVNSLGTVTNLPRDRRYRR